MLFTLSRRDLENVVSFREFLKLVVLRLFTCLLKELPRRMECFDLRTNCYTAVRGRKHAMRREGSRSGNSPGKPRAPGSSALQPDRPQAGPKGASDSWDTEGDLEDLIV